MIDVDQPHWQLQRRKAPAITLIATTRRNVDDATIISCHIARSDDNTRQMQGKNECDSHATIKYYMLLFAGCDDGHIAPRYEQQRKYTKVGYSKDAEDNTQVRPRRRVRCQKASTASTLKTAWTSPKASTARTPRRMHPSRRATTSFLPKKATTNPLPRMATGWVRRWAPCHKDNWRHRSCKMTMSLSPQRASGPRTPCKATTSPSPQ